MDHQQQCQCGKGNLEYRYGLEFCRECGYQEWEEEDVGLVQSAAMTDEQLLRQAVRNDEMALELRNRGGGFNLVEAMRLEREALEYRSQMQKPQGIRVMMIIGTTDEETTATLEGTDPIHGKLEHYPMEALPDRIRECKAGTLHTKVKGQLYKITSLDLNGCFTIARVD